MSIVDRFSTPIYIGVVRSNEILEVLIKTVEQKRLNDDLSSPWVENIETSFKYNDDIPINSFNDSPIVQDEICFHCIEFVKQLSSKELNINYENIEIKESWYNISNKGQWQNWHTHPNFDMSGCIYIKNNGTPIEFQSPTPAFVHSTFPREFINEQKSYIPSIGEVVIFPSFLSHSVPVNKGGERISITFNCNII